MRPRRRQEGWFGGRLLWACVIGVWLSTSTMASDEATRPTTRSTRIPAGGAEQAQRVADKIAELQANQHEMLNRLEEVLEELRIAKIRSTLQ